MSLGESLKKQALSMSQRAMEKVLEDQGRAQRIATALGSIQRGKQAFDKGQEELMRALSVAPKGDFKAVGKQLSSLKRRLRELEEKIDGLK